MSQKKLSDIIGAIVIVGFIASFIVHFPQWANIVLLILSGFEIFLILRK